MLGSTFIAEPDRARLGRIQSCEDLDEFVHVGLDRMTTIDFEEVLTAANVDWSEGEPVSFSEEDGYALFKVAAGGLTYVLDHAADFRAECRGDLKKLAAFVKRNGVANVYELATF